MAEKTDAATETVRQECQAKLRQYTGMTFSCTDGKADRLRPDCHSLDNFTASSWLEEYPSHLATPELHILTTQVEHIARNGFDIPYSRKVINSAIWGSEVYTDWSKLRSGGCFVLLDNPVRMVLQTPIDGFPFASLAISRSGNICKGIFSYDSPIFEPNQMMDGEVLISGWRSDGLQIVSLPKAILRKHTVWLSEEVSKTVSQLQAVEEALARPYVSDLAQLQRSLHRSQETLLKLERRSEFEAVVLSAIESAKAGLSHGRGGIDNSLAPAKAAIQLRRADLDSIPRRIEIARTSINDYIIQQTQAQSLEIAHATRKIAEATMHDSASMRTIAILTMIFLPGTAVASFFSMTMWDWNAAEGSALASSWLWIYFVVAVPLTVGVIGLWFFWMRVRQRQLILELPTIESQPAPSYRDTKASDEIKRE